jgi:hypothetical protein
MTSIPGASAATISIPETLRLLDGSFKSMADGIANAEYTLWLGSGISRGRVDDLRLLVHRVLDFLQRKIDHSSSSCPFRKALERALALISLNPRDKATIDFAVPIDSWGARDTVVSGLLGVYSKLLNIDVEREKPDYLLWEAVDVRETYANVGLKPDSEHLCVAILAMEGVIPNVASANWDGLIEAASTELSGGTNDIIRVCVKGDDLRKPELQATLLKFHGCAVRAKEDEATFRDLLVARDPQIINWMIETKHAAIALELTSYLIKHPTLVMGLSAQDTDIRFIFSKAQSMLPWRWPCNPPAYVFAEDDLGPDQLAVLQIGYGESEFNAHSQAIRDSALIRAYAKPLLVALVLQVLYLKFAALLRLGTSSVLSISDQGELLTRLLDLRNRAAELVTPDVESFVRALVAHTGKLSSIFWSGAPSTTGRYYPLGHLPVGKIANDHSLPASGLLQLPIALALLQMGDHAGHWEMTLPARIDPDAGSLSLTLASGSLKVYLATSENVVIHLINSGYLDEDDPDTLVIVSAELLPVGPRSPGAALGRTGKTRMRRVGIAGLLNTVRSNDELFQRFREELTL